MKHLLLRVIVNAGALFLAVWLLRPNIVMQNNAWYAYLVMGLIFGLVNGLIKPIVMLVSCPLIILTLGLGTLLINTLLFLLTGWLGTIVDFGFIIPNNSLWYAFLGALIVSVISFFGTRLLVPADK
jgi:putative membrane protein